MMKPVLEASPEGEWVIDPNPEIEGCALAKVMSYNDAHTEAVGMGYPSLTEALEHLDELREAAEPAAEVDGLVERLLRTKTEHRVRSGFGGLISLHDETETRETPVNPDGPDAASALTRLQAENARLKALLGEAREVVERCIKIVDRNLYHQHEKVEDVPKLLRDFLATLGGSDAK